jgi:MerR family transcriptional regulator, light-induced transcriptional regulator
MSQYCLTMSQANNPIRIVSRRTGLSAHVIRVWEKRYGAVQPVRTETNRRLYTEEQIERLSLLRDITRAGHSIGQVAKLPTAELQQLAAASCAPLHPATGEPSGSAPFLEQSLAAIQALDDRDLEGVFQRAETALGALGLLQKVISPLAQTIGERWRAGSLTAAHEHFASAVIRTYLGHAAKPFGLAESAPGLVVATPAGQLHEIGALLVGAAAANFGWRVTYLGASLPAAEIAGAARQRRARVVALSLVYPEDDARLAGELTLLRELLPSAVALVVGGRALPAYRATLEKIGAVAVETLGQLGQALDDLRKPA